MKKMKIVSSLLAMAMAATSLSAASAFAASSVTVDIGSANSTDGSFKLDIDLSGLPSSGLSTIDFAINKDSKVKITDVKQGTASSGAAGQEGDLGDTLFTWKDTGDQLVLVWATGLTDSKYWVKEGTFVTISGTVDTSKSEYKLTGGAVDREAYPGGSANSAIVFSAIGETGSEDFTASFKEGIISVGSGGGDVTTTGKGGGKKKPGDANTDGSVNVSDAVLIARVAAEDTTAKITDDGLANADVAGNGNGIDSEDVTLLLKFLAGLAKESDLGA